MKCTVDHVGIAVENLRDVLVFYRDVLGLEIDAPEDVASQRVRAQFVYPDPPASDAPDGRQGVALELLEATSADSPIARHVAKRGPGLHHLALRVPDLSAALAHLKARGIRLIDETPRPGAHGSLIAFLHPSSTAGVLIELKQG